MCGLPGFALPALGLAWWLRIHSCLRERQSGLEDEGKWQLGAQELLIMGVSLTGRRTGKGVSAELPCSQISQMLRSS